MFFQNTNSFLKEKHEFVVETGWNSFPAQADLFLLILRLD